MCAEPLHLLNLIDLLLKRIAPNYFASIHPTSNNSSLSSVLLSKVSSTVNHTQSDVRQAVGGSVGRSVGHVALPAPPIPIPRVFVCLALIAPHFFVISSVVPKNRTDRNSLSEHLWDLLAHFDDAMHGIRI